MADSDEKGILISLSDKASLMSVGGENPGRSPY